MRLKNENFRNMTINLRSGEQVRADGEGCIEVENETDAQFMLAHGGFVQTAARAPRSLSGGKPSVEELLAAIRERDLKIASLEAAVADLTARLGSQEPASGSESDSTTSGSSEPVESSSEAPKPTNGRRPKAPKPE